MTIAALAIAAAALLWALLLNVRLNRLADDYHHLRRTSRANADRAEVLIQQVRADLEARIAKGRAATGKPSWFSPAMTINDALKLHPGVKEVLASLHIGGCSSCSASASETLEQAAKGHRVDLDEMLDKMNALMDAPPAAVPTAAEAEREALERAGAQLPPPTGGRVLLGVGKVG
ncbi:MAG: DUF1858 domain-containing protein [Candidatus Sumerlaeia bacterium]|nr:DUF1858 domain-containing protein [Candidatus Sumerlaeia bacterium]